MFYVLVGREVMAVSLLEWSLWMSKSTNDRVIGRDTIDGIEVSTVFLGLDHRWLGGGPPLVFETMVFPDGDLIGRWSTIDEAEAEHDKIVAVYRAIADTVQ